MSVQTIYMIVGFFILFGWGAWSAYSGKFLPISKSTHRWRARIWGLLLIIGAFNWLAFWYLNELFGFLLLITIAILFLVYAGFAIYHRVAKNQKQETKD